MAYSITDFKFYDQEAFGGMFEEMTRNSSGINEGSNYAITLVPADNKGQFKKDSFLKGQDFITRQDYTSANTGTATYATMSEIVAPKVYRRFHIDLTNQDIADIGASQEELSFIIGQRIGELKAQGAVDTALYAASGALLSNTAYYDATASTSNTASYSSIIGGMRKMGDKAGSIAILGMNAPTNFDMIETGIADKLFEVSTGLYLYAGTPSTLGKPTLVSDSSAFTANSTCSYICGLTSGAVTLEENEASINMWAGIVSGQEKLVYRVQGEYSFNVKVKGYSFTTSTANPTNANFATSSNWTLANSSVKNSAGFLVKVKNKS